MALGIGAHATVQLTVEVSGLGSWGAGCTVEQVHRQAAEEAIGKLSRATGQTRDFRIVGKPVVRVITIDQDQPK